MNWRLALTLSLLAAAIVSGWSVWKHRPEAVVDAGNAQRSDYLLHDFEIVVLDRQGHESFTLRAPFLERHPGDRTMSLQSPLFLIPPKRGSDAAPWEVRADTGWVSAEGDELRLRGDVVASTTGSASKPVKMTTEQLNVFPDSKRATSAVAVTVTQPGSILRGLGMEALLDSRRVRLKSNVRVRYVPPHR